MSLRSKGQFCPHPASSIRNGTPSVAFCLMCFSNNVRPWARLLSNLISLILQFPTPSGHEFSFFENSTPIGAKHWTTLFRFGGTWEAFEPPRRLVPYNNPCEGYCLKLSENSHFTNCPTSADVLVARLH